MQRLRSFRHSHRRDRTPNWPLTISPIFAFCPLPFDFHLPEFRGSESRVMGVPPPETRRPRRGSMGRTCRGRHSARPTERPSTRRPASHRERCQQRPTFPAHPSDYTDTGNPASTNLSPIHCASTPIRSHSSPLLHTDWLPLENIPPHRSSQFPSSQCWPCPTRSHCPTDISAHRFLLYSSL